MFSLGPFKSPGAANIGKKALITGITGQDGSYLFGLLLSKGYEVHALSPGKHLNTRGGWILLCDPHSENRLFLHY